jgi:hypothetical protein
MLAVKSGMTLQLGSILLLAPLFAAAAPAPEKASQELASVPGWFEPSRNGDFVSRANAGGVKVTPDGLIFAANGQQEGFRWVGAQQAKMAGTQPTGAVSNYYIGARSNWRPSVPHFAQVEARSLYPGIDAVYYWTRGGQFEFDLRVAPGADPTQARLAPAVAAKLQADGSLVAGSLQLGPAVAYQKTALGRVAVKTSYRVDAAGIRFEIGAYDSSRELVIDPLVYVGFFGGNQFGRANAISTTPGGVVFITGGASSDQFIPSTPAEQDTAAGRGDAFLARLVPNASGQLQLTHYTFWGGTFRDEARAVVAGANGFVYLTGETESPDFPIYGARIQDPIGGQFDAFLVVLKPEDPEGNNIWFSSYYGGAGNDYANAITLDDQGMIYIAGTTQSLEIPLMKSGLQCCNRGASEGWMAKFNINSATPLLYSTIIGGTATDAITGIAVDAARNVYLLGHTQSSDFPVTIEPQTRRRNDTDVFLVKLDLNRAGLDALVDGFYLYGNSIDISTGLVRSGDRLYLTGYTLSTNYPVTQNGFRNRLAAGVDAFLLVMDITKPIPYPVTWGTYFGGTGTDISYGVSVGNNGWVAIAGYTTSTNFPLKDTENNQTLTAGVPSAFLSVFQPAESGDNSLKLSRVVHGSIQDIATGVAADQNGRYFASGISRSVDLPTIGGADRQVPDGAEQSFVIAASAPR